MGYFPHTTCQIDLNLTKDMTYVSTEFRLLARSCYATTVLNTALGRSSPLTPHRALVSREYGRASTVIISAMFS